MPLVSTRVRRLALAATLAAIAIGGTMPPATALAQADDPPPERPERDPARDGPGGRGQVGRMAGRLMQAVASLDLTDDQRATIREAMQAFGDDLRQIADENRDDRQAMREKVRERMRELRQQINEVLTPEQRDQLRERLVGERGERRRRGGDEAPTTRPADNEAAMNSMMMGERLRFDDRLANAFDVRGEATAGTINASGDGLAADAARPARAGGMNQSVLLATPTGLAVGQTVPADLLVAPFVGQPRPLAEMLDRGKPTIIILGSGSDPNFRDRVPDLAALAKQRIRSAAFIVIYTREAYPAAASDAQANADRNAQADVVVAPHADIESRLELARQLRDAMPGNVTVVADLMDDPALTQLAGDARGVVALVVRPDGTVAARQQWLDATGLTRLIDEAPR